VFSFGRTMGVMRKEFREMVRDWMFVRLALVAPTVVYLLFAYGLVVDVENLPVGILDMDATPASRQLCGELFSTRYFRRRLLASSEQEIIEGIQSGELRLGVIIPPGFQRKLEQGQFSPIQVWIDGMLPSRAQVTRSYISGVLTNYNTRVIARYMERSGVGGMEALGGINAKIRYWYNPALRGSNYLAPGLFMIVMILFPALLASLSVVREKELGSILAVYSSPLTKFEYIIGKTLPHALSSLLNFQFLFLCARILFDVPFRGNLLVLEGVTFIFILYAMSIGFFVSVLVRTQVAAMLTTTVATLLPGFLYSGLIVPLSSMGPEAEAISTLFGATYYVSLCRIIFLRGGNAQIILHNVIPIVGFTVALYALTFMRFKKRVA